MTCSFVATMTTVSCTSMPCCSMITVSYTFMTAVS